MTQDEIIEMARQTGWHDALLDVSFVLPTLTDFAKLVAAKAIAELESKEPVKYEHKAYTMPPQPEQKISADDFFKTIADRNPKPFPPSQREWVGLTADEYAELAEEYGAFPINQIEAKLKEKNT
jgi:hypothetical protein